MTWLYALSLMQVEIYHKFITVLQSVHKIPLLVFVVAISPYADGLIKIPSDPHIVDFCMYMYFENKKR